MRALLYRRCLPGVQKSALDFPERSHLLKVLVLTPNEEATYPMEREKERAHEECSRKTIKNPFIFVFMSNFAQNWFD